MAIAIYVKTESCDSYLFCEETPEELMESVKSLGDELAYVGDYEINGTSAPQRFKFKEDFEAVLEAAQDENE